LLLWRNIQVAPRIFPNFPKDWLFRVRRIDGRACGVHHPGPRGRLLPSVLTCGVATMIKNVVTGCVVVVLIFMVLLAYAQKHEGCVRGHTIITHEPCGSVTHSI
jgi:hypothetical protein